jgi:hypothetical protein
MTSSINAYSSIGGDLYPTVDQRGFPFDAPLGVPVTVKEARYENIPTISTLPARSTANTTTRLEFQVPATSDSSMLDLHNTYFQMTMTIGAIVNGAGLAQFACDSVVQDCEVYLGSALVSEPHSGGAYKYQAFVKDILTKERPYCLGPTTCDVSNDALTEGVYTSYPTSTTQATGAGVPAALTVTQAYMVGSTVFLTLKIKDGIFMTSKYFPSNLPLRIVLQLNLQFLFQELAADNTIATGGCALTSMQLLLNRVFLNDDSLKAQSEALIMNPFTYVLPYTKAESRQLVAGQTSFNFTGLFQGQTKPDLLVVLFQNALDKTWPQVACGSVFGGTATVSNLYARFNGEQFPPPTCFPLATDIRTYREYLKNCLVEEKDAYLDYLRWEQQYTVYCINLRHDQEKTYGLAPSVLAGNIDINVQFSVNLANPMTMWVIGMTHAKITIDSRGLVNKIGYIN